MADEREEMQRSRGEVPPTGNTPVRPLRAATAMKLVSTALVDGNHIDMQSANAFNAAVHRSQSVHLDEIDADISIVFAGIEHGTHTAAKPTTLTHLQDIDNFVAKEGLSATLDQFPEAVSYTFAVSDREVHFLDKKLLFLGDTGSFQAWARLKSYPVKLDEVEFLHFNFLSDTSLTKHNIGILPIDMYPFKIIAEKASDVAKDQLTVLIRYVFREAGGINLPFSMEAKQILKSALVEIQKAIETAGGADKLLDIRPPTKLPKSFSYINTALTANATRSANESTDQSSDSEAGGRQPLEHPPERKLFKVSIAITAKVGKPLKAKTKVQSKPTAKPKPKPKPKLKPMAAVKKVLPAKRRASEIDDEDAEQYDQLEGLEEERKDIEKEKEDISQRQMDRKREEDIDTRRMAELSARTKTLDREESRLLEGKWARWLLAYQREHKKE